MIVPFPFPPINIDFRIARCTVATKGSIRLGWLLGADWRTDSGQHIIRLDGDDQPSWHDPQNVSVHIED